MRWGASFRRSGRDEEARALYLRLAESVPDSPVATLGLAEIDAGQLPAPLISTPAEGAAEGLFALASSLTGDNNSDIAVLYFNIAIYLQPEFELARAVSWQSLRTHRQIPQGHRSLFRDLSAVALLPDVGGANGGQSRAHRSSGHCHREGAGRLREVMPEIPMLGRH